MITISLPPDIEGPLTEEAQRRGTTPELLVLDSLRTLFVPTPASEEPTGEAATLGFPCWLHRYGRGCKGSFLRQLWSALCREFGRETAARASVTLTDTGPLVALVNRNDPNHAACVTATRRLPSGPLITTWPCFTEAMYIVFRAGGFPAQAALGGCASPGGCSSMISQALKWTA